jgi:uncharacterized protein (TIGR04255 family)
MSSNPFTDAAPAEVPLANAPLVRVIVQARFPLIASVERREFIAPFQEAIRKRYPVLRLEQSTNLIFGPQGAVQSRSSTWRFHDATDEWRVSLAPDFVAVEALRYSSRKDFLERFSEVLLALRAHVDPQLVDRLGVRYVDRVTGPPLQRLRELVRPELMGALGTDLAEHIQHSITESVFLLPGSDGVVRTRWGWVPPGATVDAGAISPVDESSWILDVDAFRDEPRPLEPDQVVADAAMLATRIYSFFRWAVTPSFLATYGGNP